MYNRILRRPMFKRGGPSYQAQGTGITSGLDQPRRRYEDGTSFGELVETAKSGKAIPTDVYLNLDLFPFLEEYYPWPVEAQDSFSTIQNTNGCLAKHNYGEGYQLL